VLGGFHGRRAARAEIVLPTGVCSEAIASPQTHVETIWKLGDQLSALNAVDVPRRQALQPG